MNQYKIVYVKDKLKILLETYPYLIEQLYRPQDNAYDSKQVELLFQRFDREKKQLLQKLQEREDYTYFHGKHFIHNTLTNQNIEIIFNEYDILVSESNDKNIVFDIMKGFSSNFYMIKV